MNRHQVSTKCIICKKEAYNATSLSNGTRYHQRCLDLIIDEPTKINARIEKLENKIYTLRYEEREINSFGYKLKTMFSNSSEKINKIDNDIREIGTQINSEKNTLSTVENELQKILSSIYDYFTDYPPDWDERRKEVEKRDGSSCSECGVLDQIMHLHHKIPLSKGGSNQISNLTFLCESCHSKEHGGRSFKKEFTSTSSTFSDRISLIEEAIKKNKKIKFGYRKPTDSGYKQRTVMPEKLITVDHRSGNDSTLCISGYCELRKEERKFALKRMRGLKIV